jgi:hypothetical protein
VAPDIDCREGSAQTVLEVAGIEAVVEAEAAGIEAVAVAEAAGTEAVAEVAG